MPIRRNVDPIHVKRIWNAIRTANHSRVSADVTKIIRYLQNIDNYTVAQVELYVKQAVNEKLILPNKKHDLGNQTYKIPTHETTELDGKDWYCFECHLAGDVTPCAKCYRVFHQDCIGGARKKFENQKNTNFVRIPPKPATESSIDTVTIICDDDEPLGHYEANLTAPSSWISNESDNRSNIIFDEELCAICNIYRIDNSCEMSKTEINYLLKFVLNRIRAWLPHTITHTMAAEERPEWLTDAELTWRANQLFFEHRDMSVIEVKLNTETYSMFSEFLEDVYIVQHNVAIFHGIESQEYGAAELMIRDTIHDITEMKNCVDCYRHSNEKINSKWFCLPCRPPHTLVWAKQKGYPYWPAKVMNETETHFDVRFFGGKYERSVLLKNCVKPITMSKTSLQVWIMKFIFVW
nr:zinc finger MYND domain-containing protein 11-like [Leptinotarsa decemlineata]